mmetsp:Transcript_31775/g.40801  ORF Transcript_31775/g.40801 Transcript_31775/m.40801 type:complete len:183 (+) Transcript_31775:802-1350(+)
MTHTHTTCVHKTASIPYMPMLCIYASFSLELPTEGHSPPFLENHPCSSNNNNNNNNNIIHLETRSTLRGLRAMLQELNGDTNNEGEENDSDQEGNAEDEEPGVDAMEEDDAEDNQDHHGGDDDLLEFLEDENESDSDEFVSVAEEDSDENDSVVMEDVDNVIAKGQRAADQPRTISVSSDDL